MSFLRRPFALLIPVMALSLMLGGSAMRAQLDGTNRGIDPYDIYAGIWTENYRTLGNTPDPNGGNNIAITWDYLFPPNQAHNLSLALFGAETPFVKGSSPGAGFSLAVSTAEGIRCLCMPGPS